MLPSFDKLSRMLIQERRLKYKNKAVLGGFEKLAPNWSAEALQEVSTDEGRLLVDEISQCLHDYTNISEPDRPNFLHEILVKLHKFDASSARCLLEQWGWQAWKKKGHGHRRQEQLQQRVLQHLRRRVQLGEMRPKG